METNTNNNHRRISRVAILGAGVMGSQIAIHFANAGVPVLLLDLAPSQLTPEEEARGLALDHPSVRNRTVNAALAAATKLSPDPAYHPDVLNRIKTGNFADDMAQINRCDWIMEVVAENLEIKKKIYDQVEQHRRPGTLVTSNTSGIPIHLMAQGRSEDFRRHFCGTHFFNPPRYLALLEIIPTPDTDAGVTSFLMDYGRRMLGKTTVLAKDTPAFIANRVGVFSIMDVLHIMESLGLTVEETDKLTGPVIGHPKSATFRTADVVGLDTLVKVADNLHQGLPHDEARQAFKLPTWLRQLVESGRLGEKTGAGFYKKDKNEKGERVIKGLDISSLDYREAPKAKFATLEQTKTIDNLAKRWKVLVAGQDKAGEFYRQMLAGLFSYASMRMPEISDELYRIDDAIKAGFGWEMGIFETWDALGLQAGIDLQKQYNKPVAPWLEAMAAAGHKTFYQEQGGRPTFYDFSSQNYQIIPGSEGQISLSILAKTSKVWGNSGATLTDLGDGVLNLAFHTKMNTLGGEVIEGINKAIDLASKQADALVIANQGANFSAGANLALVLMYAAEQEFDELDIMIRQFQNTMMRVRYSPIPVVVSPHGLTLGGGCEMTLHADAVVAAAELYMGLVETGVGVIPGGGGTKEMALRLGDAFHPGDAEINTLQTTFTNIAMAKVSTSGHQARALGYLRDSDRIVMSPALRIAEAKEVARQLADEGYVQPVPRQDVRVLGRSALGTLLAGINGMYEGGYMSRHDKLVVEKLAYVICGGDLSYPQLVPEQYLLDLEREAFLSLCGERKTLERIQSVLQTGKPVRN